MDKERTLARISQQIKTCPICKVDSIGEAVPGEGGPNAKVMFIGEAPGKTEAQTGRPFVGRSGKLLRATIQEIGLSKSQVYITSPVKRLPLRGTPSREQIDHGMTHLAKQIKVINPRLLVLLGSTAIKGVLGEPLSIAKLHGEVIKRDNHIYFLSYHPAAAIRFKKLRELFTADFQKLKQLIIFLGNPTN